jgi:hypothetical protein
MQMIVIINDVSYSATLFDKDGKAFLLIDGGNSIITIVDGVPTIKTLRYELKSGMSTHSVFADEQEFTSQYKAIESLKFPIEDLALLKIVGT